MSSRQRYLLLGLSPLTLLFLLWLSQSWANPFDKDFRQGYVLALALRHGADPYQPLPALTERWLSLPQPEPFQHPTPHPFAVGWLCLPLTLLSYPRAAVAWFVFECGCLVVALLLWLRVIGRPVRWRFVGTGLFALFAWHPLVVELWFGQLAVLLTVVFLLTWLALREGRELTGGALLGSLAVLKLMGGPVLLWLVWQRRWRAVGAAAVVWLGAHALAVGVHGWALVHTYYFTVGPQVSAVYSDYGANLSPWTLGRRLFGVMRGSVATTPLWDAPTLAKLLALALPLGVLIGLLIAAKRARQFDTSFALLMGGGFLLMPIVWGHYLVMALPAMALVFHRLAARQWPRRQTAGAVLLFVLLSLPHSFYVKLLHLSAEIPAGVASLPALLVLTPIAALVGMLWQLQALDGAAAVSEQVQQGELRLSKLEVAESS
jgi:alpha-1,2-mannosyltransferase